MSATHAPIEGVNDDDCGGYVVVFAVLAVCISVFFTFIRYAYATHQYLSLRRRSADLKPMTFGSDDIFFVLSLVLAIAQSVEICSAVHYGLGKYTSSLTAHQVEGFFKGTYVARLLAVLSISCAKLSITFLYQRLDFYTCWRPILLLLSSVIAWTLFSVFSLAFVCELPSPWLISTAHCPDGRALVIAVAVLNILSDVLLVAFPIPKTWDLNTHTSRRLTTISLFCTRLLVCAVAIVDASYAARIFSYHDPAWDQYPSAITQVVLVNISLITAAMPRLYKFLVTIPSGQVSTRLPSFLVQSRPNTSNPGSGETRNGLNSSGDRDPDMPKLVPDYPVVLTTHISTNKKPGTRLTTTDAIESISASVEDEKDGAASSSSYGQADGIHKAVSVQYHVNHEE